MALKTLEDKLAYVQMQLQEETGAGRQNATSDWGF